MSIPEIPSAWASYEAVKAKQTSAPKESGPATEKEQAREKANTAAMAAADAGSLGGANSDLTQKAVENHQRAVEEHQAANSTAPAAETPAAQDTTETYAAADAGSLGATEHIAAQQQAETEQERQVWSAIDAGSLGATDDIERHQQAEELRQQQEAEFQAIEQEVTELGVWAMVDGASLGHDVPTRQDINMDAVIDAASLGNGQVPEEVLNGETRMDVPDYGFGSDFANLGADIKSHNAARQIREAEQLGINAIIDAGSLGHIVDIPALGFSNDAANLGMSLLIDTGEVDERDVRWLGLGQAIVDTERMVDGAFRRTQLAQDASVAIADDINRQLFEDLELDEYELIAQDLRTRFGNDPNINGTLGHRVNMLMDMLSENPNQETVEEVIEDLDFFLDPNREFVHNLRDDMKTALTDLRNYLSGTPLSETTLIEDRAQLDARYQYTQQGYDQLVQEFQNAKVGLFGGIASDMLGGDFSRGNIIKFLESREEEVTAFGYLASLPPEERTAHQQTQYEMLYGALTGIDAQTGIQTTNSHFLEGEQRIDTYEEVAKSSAKNVILVGAVTTGAIVGGVAGTAVGGPVGVGVGAGAGAASAAATAAGLLGFDHLTGGDYSADDYQEVVTRAAIEGGITGSIGTVANGVRAWQLARNTNRATSAVRGTGFQAFVAGGEEAATQVALTGGVSFDPLALAGIGIDGVGGRSNVPTTHRTVADEFASAPPPGTTSPQSSYTPPQHLLNELSAQGIKHNPEDVLAITRMQDGRIAFLETGGTNARGNTFGFEHVLQEHAEDFENIGITNIPEYLEHAMSTGTIVGMHNDRSIFELMHNGTRRHVAISIGGNGFVLGANPRSTRDNFESFQSSPTPSGSFDELSDPAELGKIIPPVGTTIVNDIVSPRLNSRASADHIEHVQSTVGELPDPLLRELQHNVVIRPEQQAMDWFDTTDKTSGIAPAVIPLRGQPGRSMANSFGFQQTPSNEIVIPERVTGTPIDPVNPPNLSATPFGDLSIRSEYTRSTVFHEIGHGIDTRDPSQLITQTDEFRTIYERDFNRRVARNRFNLFQQEGRLRRSRLQDQPELNYFLLDEQGNPTGGSIGRSETFAELTSDIIDPLDTRERAMLRSAFPETRVYIENLYRQWGVDTSTPSDAAYSPFRHVTQQATPFAAGAATATLAGGTLLAFHNELLASAQGTVNILRQWIPGLSSHEEDVPFPSKPAN